MEYVLVAIYLARLVLILSATAQVAFLTLQAPSTIILLVLVFVLLAIMVTPSLLVVNHVHILVSTVCLQV